MRFFVCTVFFLFSKFAFTQEIASVQNGQHSIKLIKNTVDYSLSYSDIYSKKQNTFLFPKIKSVYNIILDGFKNIKNHLIIVKTTNDTIVKFEYKSIKGVKMVKIKQNNLQSNSFGTSAFFTKDEMIMLFKNELLK